MNLETPFMQQYLKDMKDISEGNSVLSVNGSNMGMAIWNLIITHRDLKLYSGGIKPHRRWQLTPVKNYFGIKGTRNTILENYKKFLIKFRTWQIENNFIPIAEEYIQ